MIGSEATFAGSRLHTTLALLVFAFSVSSADAASAV